MIKKTLTLLVVSVMLLSALVLSSCGLVGGAPTGALGGSSASEYKEVISALDALCNHDSFTVEAYGKVMKLDRKNSIVYWEDVETGSQFYAYYDASSKQYTGLQP